MAITKKLTKPPEPPKRSDPDTFADKADTFVEWMTQFGYDLDDWTVQVNATAEQMNLHLEETKTARDEAIASVDAEVYDSGKVYNYPDVVIGSDGHCYRCLGENVSGDDPVSSTSGNWLKLTLTASEVEDYVDQRVSVELDNRFGKVTEVSLDSSDFELTEEHVGLVRVRSVSGDYVLRLGNATLFSSVGKSFLIQNETGKPVLIRNSLGGLVAIVPQNDFARLTLVDNSSSHGKWCVFQNNPVGGLLYEPNSFAINLVVSPSASYSYPYEAFSVPFDGDKFLHIWKHGIAETLHACVFKVNSDRSISSLIDPVEVSSFDITSYLCAVRLSGSRFLVFFEKDDPDTPDYSIYGAVLNWDGSSLVVELSPMKLISSSTAYCICSTALSSSEVFLAWGKSDSALNGAVISYDGSSLSVVSTVDTSFNGVPMNVVVKSLSEIWVSSSGGAFLFSYDGTSLSYVAKESNTNCYVFPCENGVLGLDKPSSASNWEYGFYDLYYDGNVVVSDLLYIDRWSGVYYYARFYTPCVISDSLLLFRTFSEGSTSMEVVRLPKSMEQFGFFMRFPVCWKGGHSSLGMVIHINENIFVDTRSFSVLELTQIAYPDVVKGGIY